MLLHLYSSNTDLLCTFLQLSGERASCPHFHDGGSTLQEIYPLVNRSTSAENYVEKRRSRLRSKLIFFQAYQYLHTDFVPDTIFLKLHFYFIIKPCNKTKTKDIEKNLPKCPRQRRNISGIRRRIHLFHGCLNKAINRLLKEAIEDK